MLFPANAANQPTEPLMDTNDTVEIAPFPLNALHTKNNIFVYIFIFSDIILYVLNNYDKQRN